MANKDKHEDDGDNLLAKAMRRAFEETLGQFPAEGGALQEKVLEPRAGLRRER